MISMQIDFYIGFAVTFKTITELGLYNWGGYVAMILVTAWFAYFIFLSISAYFHVFRPRHNLGPKTVLIGEKEKGYGEFLRFFSYMN